MLTTSTCPDTNQLQQFLAGKSLGSGHDQLAEHVSHCEHCKAAIGNLPSSVDASGSPCTTLDTLSPRTARDPECGASESGPSPDQTLERRAEQATPLYALKVGDRLDKYLILDVLGRGGMGIVFKARDVILERIVAIKILGPLLIDNAKARKRFIREGQTAAAIKSEHVVIIYGVEGHESSPYLVLEYVQGQSLEEVL